MARSTTTAGTADRRPEGSGRPSGADVVYDGIGDDYAEAALRAIAWEGLFLVVGFPSGIPSLPLNLALLKGCDIRGVFYGAAAARNPAINDDLLADLLAFNAAGKIRPVISARFPLADAANALRHPAERKALGKIVNVME